MARIESGKEFDKDENYGKMKKLLENKDTVQYSLRIPTALYKKVKIKLAQEDTKFVTVLLEMLREYVKE